MDLRSREDLCRLGDCRLVEPILESTTVKISAFTFIRNGNALGYPFVPSIRSVLPLCDEMIVNVPRSTDGTLDSVKSIKDPKIKIIESEWDDNDKSGDPIFRRHTDKPLELCTGDWCVYIQGDEVLHEESIPAMRASMERELNNPKVQGLLVDYTNFYGSYWTEVYSFGWYYEEVRVVRRDPKIRSWGGAQGFRTTDGQKLRVKKSGGRYFHYSCALEPEVARKKRGNLASMFGREDQVKRRLETRPNYYDDDQKVKPFKGTHPAVMKEIVAAADWTYKSRNPLIRFRKDYFWEDIALIVKRCTGLTVGVHRNFKRIR